MTADPTVPALKTCETCARWRLNLKHPHGYGKCRATSGTPFAQHQTWKDSFCSKWTHYIPKGHRL